MRGSAHWPTLAVHPSQHPARLADQVARALRSRRLPAKLHYLTPRQARRWLAVHDAYAPSSGRVAATTVAYRQLFEEVARQLASRPVQIVSLGCGGGQKDALLAEALVAAGCPLRYLAVDAGQALVLIAADAVCAAAPAFKPRRLVADLEALDQWREFIEEGGESGETQILCAFGITPNTDADPLIDRLARACAPGDQLLINANLYDPDDPEHALRAILPQYDNPETRRWLTTFFEDLDWDLRPEEFAFELNDQGSPARISATLRLPHDLEMPADSARIGPSGGDRLEVFFTNRFRPAELSGLLDRHGFSLCQYRQTAEAAEAVWHAEWSGSRVPGGERHFGAARQ